MNYKDLRDFIKQLEKQGELKRITVEVDPYLEMTEICDRTLKQGGPALLFENPKGANIPVLANLFGTPRRVAMGMGAESVTELRGIGELLAYLKEPEPPKGMKDAWEKFPVFKQVLNMAPKIVSSPPCQELVREGDEIDLGDYPIQTCWPEDAAPLITWPLVITKGPNKERQNLGIYRMQVIGKNKVIMRWLAHRGGALDFKEFQAAHPGQPFPVSVALGADPATILAAVTPVPDSLSEYAFAGLLRGSKTEVAKSLINDLQVPASAEIVLEGFIYPGEFAAGRPLRRPHRLLQRSRRFSGVHHRTNHPAPSADLSQHLHRQTARRTGHPGRCVKRSVRADFAKTIPGNRRFLPAAGRLLLPHGRDQHEKAVRRSRQTRDAGHLVVPAPVHVHQVRDRRR